MATISKEQLVAFLQAAADVGTLPRARDQYNAAAHVTIKGVPYYVSAGSYAAPLHYIIRPDVPLVPGRTYYVPNEIAVDAIRVSMKKDANTLRREVIRRLDEKARKLIAWYDERNAADDSYERAKLAAEALLLQVPGVERSRHREGLYAQGPVDIESVSGTSVYLKVRGVKPATAKKILELVRELEG